MRRQMIIRIRVIAGVLLFLAAIVVVRLYYVQVYSHDHYLARAEQQYVHTVSDLYTRGSIYFTGREGDLISAASLRQGFAIALNPARITDPEMMCKRLNEDAAVDYDYCFERATLAERTYVELTPPITPEAAEVVKKHELDGVSLYRTQWRYYPGSSLSARVLGFVGYTDRSDTELHGKYGLERHYDQVLFRPREGVTVNVYAQLFSNLGNEGDHKELPPGDIVSTIEPTVANKLDAVIAETNEKYNSTITGAIIMNPKTGEIYAMSVFPTFDLNDRSSSTVEDFRNPLVENVYEFGSTIKALTMAAGLDSGRVTRTSTYYDPGCIELNTKKICNYDGKGRGTVDMQVVLNQSLNTGVTHVMTAMGHDRFRDYFLNFKLGSESGIDLPNEVAGLIDNLESPRDVEYATASFGQGIALTPISATRALAALGNGGRLVTPHLVRAVRAPDGTERPVRYPPGTQVLKPETSEEISRMLTTVVDEALLGGKVKLEHHTIAAKTGTAQMADASTGKYSENDYLHSFFGYFPAYDPEFLIFMYTVKPKGVKFASETLTLPFMDMAKFLISYYSIPPDR